MGKLSVYVVLLICLVTGISAKALHKEVTAQDITAFKLVDLIHTHNDRASRLIDKYYKLDPSIWRTQ